MSQRVADGLTAFQSHSMVFQNPLKPLKSTVNPRIQVSTGFLWCIRDGFKGFRVVQRVSGSSRGVRGGSYMVLHMIYES